MLLQGLGFTSIVFTVNLWDSIHANLRGDTGEKSLSGVGNQRDFISLKLNAFVQSKVTCTFSKLYSCLITNENAC